MDWITNSTVLASIIAAFAAIIGVLLADRLKRVISNDNIATRGLQSQVEGWTRYTEHLMQRVSNLEKLINEKDIECDKRIESIESEMRRRDERCAIQIANLESRLKTLGI